MTEAVPERSEGRDSGPPREVRLNSRTLAMLAALVGGAALIVLAVGLAVALLGLQDVREELAELRGAMQGVARPPRQAPPPPEIPAEPVSLSGAQTRGSRDATLAVIEFSDFQCPYCTRFTQGAYADLVREYVDTGRVLLAFRHLPLDQIHPLARKAAEAAECAGRQGKFWEMHDRLFIDPTKLSITDLHAHAATVGLQGNAFERCLAGEAADRVTQDVAEAARLQVYGTPGFLIGTMTSDGRVRVTDRLSGAQPIQAFKAILDRLLASD